MNEDQRKKLENEAKSWLQIQINEIALRKGCALRAGQKLDIFLTTFKILILSIYFFQVMTNYQAK